MKLLTVCPKIMETKKFLHKYGGHFLVLSCWKFELNPLYTFWDRAIFRVVSQEPFYPISWNRRLQQTFSWISRFGIWKSSSLRPYNLFVNYQRTVDKVPGSIHCHDKILDHNQSRCESLPKCVKPIIALSDARKWRFPDNALCNNVPLWL